jgi:DNA repair and recombination protein RAD52
MGFTLHSVRRPRRMKSRRRGRSAHPYGLPRRVLALLEQPLDPFLVSERETSDGRLVRYIEGWAAIGQANGVFGFDGWGAEVIGEVAYRPVGLTDPDSGEALAVGMYTGAVRVSVRGCPPKADVGCAFASDDTPEAHEAAYKGAVTDAMKRALRHFGDQFGNGLYDRRNGLAAMPDLSEGEATPQPSAPASSAKVEEMRRKVVELSARLGLDESKALVWVEKRYGWPLEALGAEQVADAVRSLADELNRRNGLSAGRRGNRRAA